MKTRSEYLVLLKLHMLKLKERFVVRMHRNMNKLLLNQIERDGIYVF